MRVFLFGADSPHSAGVAAANCFAANGHSVTALTWFDTRIRKRGQAPIDYINGQLDDRTIMRRFEKADAVIDTVMPRNHAEDSLDPIPPSQVRARILRRLLAGTGKPLIVITSFCTLGNTGRQSHTAICSPMVWTPFDASRCAAAVHRGCGFRGEPSGISAEEARRLLSTGRSHSGP
jgi:hypothetical protein